MDTIHISRQQVCKLQMQSYRSCAKSAYMIPGVSHRQIVHLNPCIRLSHEFFIASICAATRENLSSEFPTRSDINWLVQLQ